VFIVECCNSHYLLATFSLFARFIEHIVEHLCRYAEARNPIQSESDFNMQSTQMTGVVSELRTVSEESIEVSVRLLEEQDGRENVE